VRNSGVPRKPPLSQGKVSSWLLCVTTCTHVHLHRALSRRDRFAVLGVSSQSEPVRIEGDPTPHMECKWNLWPKEGFLREGVQEVLGSMIRQIISRQPLLDTSIILSSSSVRVTKKQTPHQRVFGPIFSLIRRILVTVHSSES